MDEWMDGWVDRRETYDKHNLTDIELNLLITCINVLS